MVSASVHRYRLTAQQLSDRIKLIRFPLAIFALAITSLAGCVTTAPKVLHSYSFALFADGQNIELLDYRFGLESDLALRAAQWQVDEGRVPNQSGVSGYMKVVDRVYVKWKRKPEGTIYEKTVIFGEQLPKDMTRHRIHFGFKNRELVVYLVTPQLLAKGEIPIEPNFYESYKAIELFPRHKSINFINPTNTELKP